MEVNPIIGIEEGDLWYIDLFGEFDPTGNVELEPGYPIWFLYLEDLRKVHNALSDFFRDFDNPPPFPGF